MVAMRIVRLRLTDEEREPGTISLQNDIPVPVSFRN